MGLAWNFLLGTIWKQIVSCDVFNHCNDLHIFTWDLWLAYCSYIMAYCSSAGSVSLLHVTCGFLLQHTVVLQRYLLVLYNPSALCDLWFLVTCRSLQHHLELGKVNLRRLGIRYQLPKVHDNLYYSFYMTWLIIFSFYMTWLIIFSFYMVNNI
jgi:hypothetical protein